jgi:peptidoglycan LD-endopeptidase CwlK
MSTVDTADRNIAHLQPFFAAKLAMILDKAKAQGWDVRLIEGLRSFERSDYLYAQGRTRPGQIVTNARGGSSRHNFALSGDLYPYVNGAINLDFDRSPKLLGQFQFLAKYALSIGVSWGGNWKSFKDYPHFEISTPDLAVLRKIYPHGWIPGQSKERAWL